MVSEVPFTTLEFRRTMGQFATGITVVTTVLDGKFYGLTVNAFCSISLEPPLVMISIDKKSQSHQILQTSRVYAVNILNANQQELSERFARKTTPGGKPFHDIPLQPGLTGAPLFDEALARIECQVVNQYDGGDHTLFIGQVIRLDASELDQAIPGPQALLYFQGKYGQSG